MSKLFLTVLNMSLEASYVILFVILLRLLLKKMPKVISYALWGVVAFRLIIPFSFESSFSIIPRNINLVLISSNITSKKSPLTNNAIELADPFVEELSKIPTLESNTNTLQTYIEIGAYIWILVLAALLIYSLISFLQLKKQLKNAKGIDQNIYQAENLKTPFVLGLIKPKIYLPIELSKEEEKYILLHEQIHIQRKDHIIKIFAFLLSSLHWYNPLVWISFILMSTDMELSCDEKVLKEMKEDIKIPYANSLLSLATDKSILNGSFLAFGEGNVKRRIKNVLNYKKPRFWIVAIAIIGVITAVIGLISNPENISPSMMWAKSLQVEDIQSIELIVEPSSQSERYKKYQEDDFSEIVDFINQARGRLIKNPEIIAGGGQSFYITSKDGIVHQFANSGNLYLKIDGDTYKAGYDWLSKWDYKGDNYEPQGFWERVGIETSSYELMQLKYGEVMGMVSPLSEDSAKVARDAIMDHLIKSTVWPGPDIKTLEKSYLLRQTYSDGSSSDYYMFLQEGKRVMQQDGFYSIINDDLYKKLVEILQ